MQLRYVSFASIGHRYRECVSDLERFNQTLFNYFGMLLLCLMVKMFELKELCFQVLMESSFI